MPKKGYVQTPEHRAKNAAARQGKPRKNARGWIHNGRRVVMHHGAEVFEHRVVMESMLGRTLTRGEVVHHKNHDPLDNRPENLQLMTRSEHITHHNTGKIRAGTPRRPWTEAERETYRVGFKKRPPPSPETRAKMSEGVRKARAAKFWSSRPKHHETAS